ncbi:MAG: glycosyltransferase [Gloeocapsa sp. DLM2.Bin57]|nr:MAG: glycosyltransferase [Gloeocapsa sp. DLM2.Bin57]
MLKLIIPIPYYVPGGVEKVMLALITEFSQQLEQVIIVASPKTINYFRTKLPENDSLVYEYFGWADVNHLNKLRQIGLINRFINLAEALNLTKLSQYLNSLTEKINYDKKIIFLSNKYQANYCLYLLANKMRCPNLNIPLAMVSYDLFWRCAPLKYSKEYQNIYDNSLLNWLKKANHIVTISAKTKQEINKKFPGFTDKISPVPLAGYSISVCESIQPENIFYFPSSFSIYKDHLTLIKAGLLLAEKQLNFQILLTGKETDKLVKGDLDLSQQKESQEYQQYLREYAEIYQENQEVIQRYFVGLGYGELEQVEKSYAKSLCVVMPSIYEGFGLAISEAVTRGLPVIASDLDVFHEQVELYQCSDRVEFFPPGDAETLAKLMEKMLLHPQQRLSQSEIERRFSHWTWREVAQEYINILVKLPQD